MTKINWILLEPIVIQPKLLQLHWTDWLTRASFLQTEIWERKVHGKSVMCIIPITLSP